MSTPAARNNPAHDTIFRPLLPANKQPVTMQTLLGMLSRADSCGLPATAVNNWLYNRAGSVGRDAVTNKPMWQTAVTAHNTYRRNKALGSHRRPAARQLVAGLATLDPRLWRAAVVTAHATLQVVDHDQGWDSALVGAPELAALYGASPRTWVNALNASVEHGLLLPARSRPGGARRFRCRSKLRAGDGVAADCLEASTVALVDRDNDDMFAVTVRTVSHPAWGHSPGVVDHRVWLDLLHWWAVGHGVVVPPRRRRKSDVGGWSARLMHATCRDELFAVLDELAAETGAESARDIAEQKRAAAAAARADQVRSYRVRRHVAALIDGIGAVTTNDRAGWCEAAVTWRCGGGRNIALGDLDATAAAVAGLLVDAGAEPGNAGTAARLIVGLEFVDNA